MTVGIDIPSKDGKIDLSPAAIKVARRLQSLPAGRSYQLTFTKLSDDKWLLSVGEDRKIEVVK